MKWKVRPRSTMEQYAGEGAKVVVYLARAHSGPAQARSIRAAIYRPSQARLEHTAPHGLELYQRTKSKPLDRRLPCSQWLGALSCRKHELDWATTTLSLSGRRFTRARSHSLDLARCWLLRRRWLQILRGLCAWQPGSLCSDRQSCANNDDDWPAERSHTRVTTSAGDCTTAVGAWPPLEYRAPPTSASRSTTTPTVTTGRRDDRDSRDRLVGIYARGTGERMSSRTRRMTGGER